MRAGHAFAEDAPDTALVLLDGPPGATDVAALQRLIVDAGRYGFDTLQLIHGPQMGAVVSRALTTLPALSPLPEVTALPHGEPFAALAPSLARLGPRTLVMEGLGPAPWNWLDPMAAVAPGRAGVATLVESGMAADGAAATAFALDGDRTVPVPDGTGGLTFAGHAILERHALEGLADTGALTAALLRLAEAGHLGGRPVGLAEAPPTTVPAEDATSPSLPTPSALRDPRPALFLDRDGTLNVDYGYVYDPERLIFLPGAAAAVKRANDLGFYVFLVTNQSGVGRGYYTEADVERCNATLQRHLRAFGAHLDDIRYCADHPDALLEAYRRPTGWRKPAPGMLLDLMAHWPVLRAQSLMVGDKDSDVGAGHAAGVKAVKFAGGDLDAFLAPRLLSFRGMGAR